MSWDPFQRAALAELGHVVLCPVAGPAAVGAAGAERVDAAMLARLAMAAGISMDALRGHADVVARAAALRGNAGEKRALWPRLRALRRVRQ